MSLSSSLTYILFLQYQVPWSFSVAIQVFFFKLLISILHSAIFFAMSFSWVAKCPFLFKTFFSSEQSIRFPTSDYVGNGMQNLTLVCGSLSFLREESHYTIKQLYISNSQHPYHTCALLDHQNVPVSTKYGKIAEASYKEMCREICFFKKEHSF